MIDDRKEIGGVWTPIELFGLSNVENAVHYFLDNQAAFPYMKNVLGWNITETEKKYRLFPQPLLGMQKAPYDNRLARYMAHIREQGSIAKPTRAFLKGFFKKKPISRYIHGGTAEIYEKVKDLLKASNVTILTSSPIERIFLNEESKQVEVTTRSSTFFGKTIYVTHGSRIGNILFAKEGKVTIDEQRHLRPQVHLLVQDTTPDDIHEGIYVADPLIKYVHDITRFTKEAQTLTRQKKLLVVALQMDCKDSPALIQDVMNKLKQFKVVGPAATLEQYKWWDTYLPALDDTILENLRDRFPPLISILKTEDFTAGIANRAAVWSTHLQRKTAHG